MQVELFQFGRFSKQNIDRSKSHCQYNESVGPTSKGTTCKLNYSNLVDFLNKTLIGQKTDGVRDDSLLYSVGLFLLSQNLSRLNCMYSAAVFRASRLSHCVFRCSFRRQRHRVGRRGSVFVLNSTRHRGAPWWVSPSQQGTRWKRCETAKFLRSPDTHLLCICSSRHVIEFLMTYDFNNKST